jgi:hypothetical protein
MMLAQPHASLASTSNFGLGHRYNGGSGVWWPVLIFVSNESGYMPPSCQLRSVLARLCGILIERYWVGAASTTTRTSPAARPQPGAKIQSSSLHTHFHEESKGHCRLNRSASCDGSDTFYSLQTREAMTFVQSKCTATGNALPKSNVIWSSLYRKKGAQSLVLSVAKSMLLAIVFS